MTKSKYVISQRVGDYLVKFGSDALNSDLKSLHLATKSSNGFSLSSIFAHLFPKGYPASVAPGYKKYAVGQAVAMTLSAAGGVLSTKALLVGLGIGASSAAPMAGALNWIIKDGIGQIGGIAFASAVSDKFDENPKRWRLLSSMAMDASAVLELCTPLFPTLFLPIAAAANIVHSNLADVTAKCGSQSIMASMLGTGLGLLIAGGIPGEYGTCGSSAVTGLDQHAALSMGCFLALSGGALTANYISLRHVPSTALTLAKLDFIFRDFWDQCATRPGVDTGVGDAARLLQPSDLSTRDIFVAVPPLYPEVEQSVGGSLLDSTARIEDVDALVTEFVGEQYCIVAYGRTPSQRRAQARLLLKEDAMERDVLRGLLHLHIVRRLLADRNRDVSGLSGSAGLDLEVVRESRRLLYEVQVGSHCSGETATAAGTICLLDRFLLALCPGEGRGGTTATTTVDESSDSWVVDAFVLEKNKCRICVTVSPA